VTPRGEIRTRYSAIHAANAAPTGKPIATFRTSINVSARSDGKNGAPVNGIPASGARMAKNNGSRARHRRGSPWPPRRPR